MAYLAIVDYGSGNLRSAAKAFERAARESGAALEIRVTGDPREVGGAERIVLPGVGAFADCRAGLFGVAGMVETLQRQVIERGRPFLGICVGMQLMASRGVEYGVHPGLDWIGGEVNRLTPADPGLKIPHMGWNELDDLAAGHRLLEGLAAGDHAYFVHSYKFDVTLAQHCLASTDHGGRFAAMIGRDNLAGTQFHPEKSQRTGLRLLANFLHWSP